MKAADLIEDVEMLLSAGESPERIATRLGKSAATIARALYRARHNDLARPFSRIASRERYHERGSQ